MVKRGFSSVLIATLLMGSGMSAAESERASPQFYRYKDANGVTVMNSQIPPEFVANGYEVVNAQGMVLKTVPRALTEEERARQSDELKRQAAEAEQRKKDEALLLRYSTIEDIEADKQRTIGEIDVRISILRGNIIASKQQVERELARAADLQRAGRQVPPQLLKAIEDLKRDIADNEANIAQREQEKLDSAAAFDRDIERMRFLLDKLQRRSH